MTPTLFTPLKHGSLALQHRIVMAPMTRNRATLEGVPTSMMVEYYKQRATPGGLLISEATGISATSGGYHNTPFIYSKEQIDGWKQVTNAVHANGGLIFAQLWHLGRTTYSYLLPDNQQIVSASDIKIPGDNPFGGTYEAPRALTKEEIQAIVGDFASAAQNAIEAGFDGIEIHGANGYLVDQFINSSSNQRTDDYGGSKENRARFALEVVDAVSKAIGPEKTAIRLSPYGDFQGMDDEDRVGTFSHLTQQLQDQHPRLAYVHFMESRLDQNPDDKIDPFRAIWQGLIVSTGNYTYDYNVAYKEAEKAANEKTVFGFARAYLANPDLVERVRNHLPLNDYDRSTFFAPLQEKGYTDYPFYEEVKA
ncbi:12-oxo-phytodienoic acid-like protein [Gongronella butleri]|nr:12-oxo-phytodienoic acid-like protein [Gongronella butleri]